MNTKDDGGPAYPATEKNELRNYGTPGMSLRDYFAGQAMQAMLSSSNCPKLVDEKKLADQAYETADAMLEARK